MTGEATVRQFALAKSYGKSDTGIFVELAERPPVVSFKRLEGAKVTPLPREIAAMGTLSDAFAALTEGPPKSPSAPLLNRLATLLTYNLGIIRREVFHAYNHHRAVPSPRCLYPSEIYLWVSDGDLPEGLYHYLPADHALTLVRPLGREWIEAVLGVTLDGSVDAVLFTGLDYWRVAYLYGDFAYRLCMLEAGHLTGNLALTGAALGWHVRVHFQFADRLAHELLGLAEHDETVTTAVVLSRDPIPVRERVETGRQPTEALPPLHGRWHTSHGMAATNQTAWMLAVERATALAAPAPFRANLGAVAAAAEFASGQVELPNGAVFGTSRSLERALYERNSGYGTFGLAPMPVPLPFEQIAGAMVSAMSAYSNDLTEQGSSAPGLDLYAVCLRVEGLEPGVYRYVPGRHALELVRAGNFARAVHDAYMFRDSVNVAAHGLVWFLAGDLNRAIHYWGSRGYRNMLLEAGMAAQWLSLWCGGNGLFARGSCSYEERACDELLGLVSSPDMLVYQVLVGTNRSHGLRFDLRPHTTMEDTL